jgi:hypothetical protein
VAGHRHTHVRSQPSRSRGRAIAVISAAASDNRPYQQQQQQLLVPQQAAVQQQQPTVTLTGLVAALGLAATALFAAAATCFMLYLRPVIQVSAVVHAVS